MKRLFLAFDLPDRAREAVAEIQAVAKTQFTHSDIRWVASKNFHITVHFIGDLTEDAVPVLVEALRGVDYPPRFEMELSGVSAFPNKKKPHILHVETTFRTEAFGVVKRTANVLAEFGVEINDRPWEPHITIGRVKKQAEVFKPEEITVPDCSFDTDHVVLYESNRTAQGSVYTKMERFPLSVA